MPERVQGSTRRKLALGGASAIVALASALIVTHACAPEQEPPSPEPPAQQPAAPKAKAPAPTPLPPPVSRAEILSAAALAASDYALGGPSPADRPALVGRRFEVRVPFGCEGPATPNGAAQAGWRYGPEGKTVRITVEPGDWTGTALARELGGPEAYERIEGYWIPRAWLATADCPAVRTDPLQSGQSAPTPNTVGLVTLHPAGGSRLEGRRDRPYEVTIKAPEDGRPAPRGYRLVLSGRITGFPNGRAFRCRAAGPDQRPVCVLAVAIERVAIVDPARDAVLGEWT